MKNENTNKPATFHKKVQKREEYFVEFTDEESEALGIKEGDKFEVLEDGEGILLKKFKTIDLDLADFDRDTLEFLVAESFRTKAPVEDVIAEILTKTLEEESAKLEAIRKTKALQKQEKKENSVQPLDTPENL
jgi:bifunctional DNA-binding transcriptional regulator/antitoxin component of YhaV-PrlF toxin-antitoxin module